MPDHGTSDASRGSREQLAGALQLLALSSLAIAQPLFDVLRPVPEFFVVRDSRPVDVYVLVLVLLFAPPAAMLALELAAGLASRTLRRGLHLAFIVVLVALALLPPLRRGFGAQSAAWVLVALLAGAGAALAVARWRTARSLLTALSPIALAFAAIFLLDPAVRPLLKERVGPEQADVRVDSTTSVVLVIFDELPLASLMNAELEIDAQLFPNFARLAADGTWFRNATSSNPLTVNVIPAIVTGLAPSAERAYELGRRLQPIAADHPRSLFTLLRSSHRLRVQETLTSLCPDAGDAPKVHEAFAARMCSLFGDLSLVYAHVVLPARIAAGLPPVTENWGDFRRAGPRADPAADRGRTQRTRYFRDFIASVDDSAEPTLYYLHVLLPHTPWMRLPSGKQYLPLQPFPGHEGLLWGPEESATNLALQQHLLQLGHTDALLGELIERLKERGVYDCSVIVVLADHGMSFQPGEGRRKVTDGNVRDIMHVPMIVKAPFQTEARVSDRNVESIDVLPTIAHAMGIELPWKLDGVSALDERAPERAEKNLHGRPPVVVAPTLPERWSALEHKLRLFGPAPSWDEIHAIGPRRHLLGRSVAELGALEILSAQAYLEGEEWFARVDPAAGALPACVVGRISVPPQVPVPEELAVAVGGVIRSVAQTYQRTARGAAFAAMLPEKAFVDGANEVRVLAVLEGERLAWIPSLSYSLVESGAGAPARIVRSDGVSFAVVPDRIRGRIELARIEGAELRIEGYAADPERKAPAEVIVVLAGGRVLSVPTGLAPALPPGTVDGELSRALSTSGFRLHHRFPAPPDLTLDELRIFALSGSEASELDLSAR